MKRIIGMGVVVVILLFSANAFAQDEGGDTKTKFYNFDDMLVDGQLKTPDLMKEQVQGRARFERLLNLKKSFIPKIQESTEEDALQ